MIQLYRLLLLILLLTAGSGAARGQSGLPVLNGRVITEGDEPLVGATVIIRGTFLGSGTNSSGEFLIPGTGITYPLIISVAYVGYETQLLTVQQPDEPILVTMIPARAESQVMLAASRQEENIMRVPVTVEKVTQAQIRKLNQPDLLSSLTQFKGIDVNTSSMLTNSISTRGFNSANSERVIQLVDYMDVQSPSLSLGAGNSLGLPDIDVASVEVLYGPSSALYGANAFNGVVLLNSRDAFTDEGLSVRLRGGQRDYFDGQLRYAKRLGRRWAIKLTGSYLTANDWLAENYTAQKIKGLVFDNNPAGSSLGYNAVNRYGDLGLTYSTNSASPKYSELLGGRTVFLPGWTERELMASDDGARLYRVVPSISYLFTDKVKATFSFERAQGSTTLQNISRFRLKNFGTNQYRFALEGEKWFVRAFQTKDFGNDTYDLTYLGASMQNVRSPISGEPYFVDYFTSYAKTYEAEYKRNGGNDGAAQAIAQATAASAQLQAGSPEFNALRQRLVGDNTSKTGARVNPSSFLTDASGQYKIGLGASSNLILGGAYREFRLHSEGRLFEDGDGRQLRNYEFGGYAQLSKTLFEEHLKLTAAGRLDNFQNFGTAFSPRVSAVYSLGSDKQHNFRGSYGRAFRSPTQLDQYTDIDLAIAVFRGNVGQGFQGYRPDLRQGLMRIMNSTTPLATLAEYEFNLAPLRLEEANSFEAGYKGLLLKNLTLDLSGYYSYYRDFVMPSNIISNLNGTRPTPNQLIAGAPELFENRSLPTRLLVVSSNLDLLVRTQGMLASLSYVASRNLTLSGNYSLNVLLNPSDEVPFYNTPRHKFNFNVGGELNRRLGYSLNYRWAQAHRYESTFAAGSLAAYQTLDAQLRYALPKMGTTIDLGGSNTLNTNNIQVFGGPQIGRLVYIGLTTSIK